jgi:beta-glucosidase
MARESLVLLQNDGSLPLALDGCKKIAVIGPSADDPQVLLGDWSLGSPQYPPSAGTHPRACTVTLLDGIRARVPASVSVVYEKGCSLTSTDESDLPRALAAASDADVIVLSLGDALPFIGETHSTGTLELTGGQRGLLEAIARLGKPFVLALVNSKPLVLPQASDAAQAIVECWNPGMQGGTAFAELLFGDFNPTGKLTISFPKHVGQQPSFYSQVRGQHGDSYADIDQKPRFPFGFGLSYTRFEYSNLRVTKSRLAAGEALELCFELHNRGDREGTEIAQVYASDLVTSVTWVNQSLVAFTRETLAAGERRTVTLSSPQERLSLVDAYEQRVVEPGEFEIAVASSSSDPNALRARFVISGESFSFSRIPGVLRK